jgi:hypothetical protein
MKEENKKQIFVFLSIVITIVLTFTLISNRENFVGLVAYANIGCCDLICQETSLAECPGNLHPGQDCNSIKQCNVGCCIDKEGYCLDNYLKGSCEDQGTFEAKSCINVPQCVVEKEKQDMAQSIGYPIIYTQDSLIFSEPITGKWGLPFVVKALLFKQENISNIDVQITSTDHLENLTLFDDGNHGDGNANDNLFAAVWQSKNVPPFKGIKNFELSQNGNKNNLILSASDCLPLSGHSINKNNTQNIIFVGYEENKEITFFKNKANNLFNVITEIAIKKSLANIESVEEYFSENSYNYYVLAQSIDQPNKNLVLDKVINQCNFIFNINETPSNETNDEITKIKNIIFFLDEDFPYCEQNKDYVHVNPEFIINASVTSDNTTQTDFIENFCDYVITKEELKNKYMGELVPPYIQINEIIFNQEDNPDINLDFTIYDNKNETINYTIYLDLDHPLMYLKQNLTTNGTRINLNLTIPDGKHIMWIEAEDIDGNMELSKAIPIEKNVNDFRVIINSLDEVSHLTSPEIRFGVFHKVPDFDLSYEIYANKEVISKGEVKPLFEKSVKTELPDGEHVIYIVITDKKGNKASSWPYKIIVGTEVQPETYSANIEWYEE